MFSYIIYGKDSITFIAHIFIYVNNIFLFPECTILGQLSNARMYFISRRREYTNKSKTVYVTVFSILLILEYGSHSSKILRRDELDGQHNKVT
jgi:hypothetical protein